MRVLIHNEINPGTYKRKLDAIMAALSRGEFHSAQVKKLKSHPNMYRAKLDDKARLIFQLARNNEETCVLALEILKDHDYSGSRFLRGRLVSDADFADVTSLTDSASVPLKFLNDNFGRFHYLDRPLSFDDVQESLLSSPLPIVTVGSAGSGKTVLALEKMKQLTGDVLYVTHSAHLAEAARGLYYSSGYENEQQNIEFLSFRELLETYHVPDSTELTFSQFRQWFGTGSGMKLKDPHRVFEEIRGVLTGSGQGAAYLSRAEYLALGVKQSIYPEAEREGIYTLFDRYRGWLSASHLYDPNILSFEYLSRVTPRYDFAFLDEVQDFTIVQIQVILSALHRRSNFLMSGDSNQIVHPNFFSWSKLKTFFYQSTAEGQETLRVLHANYRNGTQITELANKILILKQRRFGSIDRESNYLVTPSASAMGSVSLIKNTDTGRKEINEKTKRSSKVAVIVLNDEHKVEAKRHFSTPLIFSIHEAKGLEYETVVLFDLVASAATEFRSIAEGVRDLSVSAEGLDYLRSKDKSDKSGEIYKFFINSLYVAATRAVENLVIIESATEHPILRLLGLGVSGAAMHLKEQKSSVEEWQQEARKLELQGRHDQAEQIRREIVKNQPVPWKVLSAEDYPSVKALALNSVQVDKKARHSLFEFAVTYGAPSLIRPLVDAGYSYARDYETNSAFVRKKLYYEASKSNSESFLKAVRTYGVEHRNPLNETPLMVAVRAGNVANTRMLVELGADLRATDLLGLTAYHKGLRDVFLAHKDLRDLQVSQGEVLTLVQPASIKIKIQDRMIKLDAHTMEFFVMNLLLATFMTMVQEQAALSGIPSVKATELTDRLLVFHDNVLPARRKVRTYINHILAKNEIEKTDPHCRPIFMRIRTGYYIVNPLLEIEVGSQWVNFYDFIGFRSFPELLSKGVSQWIEQWMPKMRAGAEKSLNDRALRNKTQQESLLNKSNPTTGVMTGYE
jgi:UvrD-like helicase C-terminal domain